MMPNCQNCWNEDKQAVFLGEHEYPCLCEEHLCNLEDRIAEYRKRNPRKLAE